MHMVYYKTIYILVSKIKPTYKCLNIVMSWAISKQRYILYQAIYVCVYAHIH